MKGRFVVGAILAIGIALAIVAVLARGRGEPRLPLRPGTVVLVTFGRSAESAGIPALGPFEVEAHQFRNVHATTSDPIAALGALVTGRRPRENGLVRAGDAVAREVPVLAELLAEAGFGCAAFVRGPEELMRAGLARGATQIVVDESGDGSATVERALGWIRSRGAAPSFCQVHFAMQSRPAGSEGAVVADGEELSRRLFAGLAELGAGERLVAVAIALGHGDGRFARTRLRIPPGLIPPNDPSLEVSLLDVVPSLLELFGVRAHPGLGEPHLLAPGHDPRRMFLFSEPMLAPFEDCDAVRLVAGSFQYCVPAQVHPDWRLSGENDDLLVRWPESPRASGPFVDDPAVKAEMRSLLEQVFGYRLEEITGPDGDRRLVARYVGRAGR